MPRGKAKRKGKRASGVGLRESILAQVTKSPGEKTSEIADALEIAQLQVRNELMQMESRGEVYRTGQTRGTRWFLGEGPGNSAAQTGPAVPAGAPGRRGPKERVLDEHRELLGKIPDAEVADRTGASIRTIAAYRKKYNIAGYTGPRRRTDAVSPPAKGGQTKSAWKLEFRVRNEIVVRYAFASGLGEAAQVAGEGAKSFGGEVVGLALVGEAL